MDTHEEIARMRYEAHLPSYDTKDMICFNCRHWSYDKAQRMGIANADYALCAKNAVQAEEPDTLVLVGSHAHCRWSAEAFDPCPEFLAELATLNRPAA